MEVAWIVQYVPKHFRNNAIYRYCILWAVRDCAVVLRFPRREGVLTFSSRADLPDAVRAQPKIKESME